MLNRTRPIALAIAVALLAIPEASAQIQKKDRHAGYYYPEPTSVETFRPRVRILPGSNRTRRIGFVVGLTTEILARPFAPEYSLFAKGSEAEKLIIVANRKGTLDTIYRVRALLATLTSVARATPVFQEQEPEPRLTFFDLAALLGFKQITVSDGDGFAHQVLLK
ncbi:MAG: molybdopterin-guanine dinucleotide biosynthesis protein A [Proteobacteria bacterium]|nr:molybdopterin-guanine dinucleotide biosynthesis protein A [Pseudomonadota bacterium]